MNTGVVDNSDNKRRRADQILERDWSLSVLLVRVTEIVEVVQPLIDLVFVRPFGRHNVECGMTPTLNSVPIAFP